MQENRSYVFFRELDGEEGRDGPLGAEGVPLTPGRSLAVDAAYHRAWARRSSSRRPILRRQRDDRSGG